MFLLLQSVLGLEVRAADRIVKLTRPRLPTFIDEVRISGLRVGPDTLDLEDTASTRWLGLDVKRHTPLDADHATVEFVARYRVGGGSAFRLHEISRFVREDGRWYYVDGVLPPR